MKSSNNCLDIIKEFEGFRAEPYLCPAKVPTIGYGSTRYPSGAAVSLTDPAITEAHGCEILRDTLGQYEAAVSRLVRVPLNQNQFDALVDFAYNCGVGNLEKSTLLKLLNGSDYKGAAMQFGAWVKGGGVELPGLVRRRAAERKLFEA
jgi:lysozyme